MLMFVFGAGASFDSDPSRRPDDPNLLDFEAEHRPPIATGLFDPASRRGKEVVAAFPRAGALIMRLRQATKQGLDVEEVLEQIKGAEEVDPETAVELLAFRAYLARLLHVVPGDWLEECQGLTNYVLALDKAKRWNIAVHTDLRDPVTCITFNYDTLLEQAVNSVFGHRMADLSDYANSAAIHVYKPHGSVTWRMAARWDIPDRHLIEDEDALQTAVNKAASLVWEEDTWAQVSEGVYQDRDDGSRVWLPALSIPVRRKSDFTMPAWHRQSMGEDLGKVTTLVAVGWRARERHFLQLLQDRLPNEPVRLVAVAENDVAAQETVDSLWETGRFGSYAVSGVGFSGFTETPTGPFVELSDHGGHTALTLDHVLSAGSESGIWRSRRPGTGLEPSSPEVPFMQPNYAKL